MTDKIQICDFFVYKGRNIYSHKPIMKMIVDIGKYSNIPTKDIRGFNERLLEAFPGLKTNCCGLGYEGGFLEKLNEGTYLAHVLEHVILEMQYMLGYDVSFGKTRLLKEPSVYYLVYQYQNEVCGMECSKVAVFILNCFLRDQDVLIEDFIEYLRKISVNAELGPSTSAIVEESKRRNLPIMRIGNESLVQIGYGKYSRVIESTLTDATSCISVDISSNKQLTKFILRDHKIPVPYGKVVYSEWSAVAAAKQIGMPVVVKPFNGNQGKGVYLNLNSDEAIREAFLDASKYSSGVIVESFVKGRDFRVLVVGNKVAAVAERLPALVVGDGLHTVKELVDIVNSDPSRGDSHEKPLTKIRLDSVALNLLKKNGMDENYIPGKDEVVKLRENGNLSTGGTAIDYTDSIHPDNAQLAIRAANAIGIDIAGIDFVTDDISRSILDTGGVIVEVNTAPGIRMHLYPSVGKPRNVAADIVDFLFPEKSYEFPIVSVTGTNGKTTTVRLISHVLTLMGKSVGMTTTSGTFIGDQCICRGDNSGPCSAKTLLSNKKIDVAVFETARGGIIRQGLGYDLADVGVITNISFDHLGSGEVRTLEDLAYVKSLVVEAVKPGGYAVLNASDGMTGKILKNVKSKVILFSKNAGDIKKYESDASVWAEDGKIKLFDGENTFNVADIDKIPITFKGKIECNIENSLCAAGALFGLGVPVEKIAEGLESFKDNKGRFSLFEYKGAKIMLDYGHNLACYENVIGVCKKMNPGRLVGIIGMPGDRQNSDMEQVARLCAREFDSIIIKEDADLRGREKGEVASIMYGAAAGAKFDKENVKIIEDELEALREAVSASGEGDLIVVFYERLEPLLDYMNEIGAEKVE